MIDKLRNLIETRERLWELRDEPIEDFVDWNGLIDIINDHIDTIEKLAH